MSIPAELRQLEADGYFEKVRTGDHRAGGLFARLAAHALNPTGDPAGWGCLRKTGGGQNVEGYSEDAIVLGNDPNNLNNVRDIIGGAGAPGASLAWGGFVNRRTSDVWEKPVPLTQEQLQYLKPGAPPPPPPPPPAPPAPTLCQYQAVDLAPVLAELAAVRSEIQALRAKLDAVPAPAPVVWPIYRAQILGQSVTLRPEEP